jgi:hypothetical protein
MPLESIVVISRAEKVFNRGPQPVDGLTQGQTAAQLDDLYRTLIANVDIHCSPCYLAAGKQLSLTAQCLFARVPTP